jgi:DNA-directed RNA polymerase alpha subunit
MNTKATLRTCEKGHRFFKSTDCPTCPVCESEKRPLQAFLAALSAPARRALEQKCIATLHQLSTFSEKDILRLHGVGPASLPILRKALSEEGLTFKTEEE